MIFHFNKSSVSIRYEKLQILFTFIKEIHTASVHSHSIFISCFPWRIDARLSPHMLNGSGSMTFSPNEYARDPTLVDIWRPSYRSMKYTSSLAMALRCLCFGVTVTFRRPRGLLAVTSRNLIPWIVRLPCGRRNFRDHNYGRPQNNTIKEIQTVDRRTVRRQHDMWLRH